MPGRRESPYKTDRASRIAVCTGTGRNELGPSLGFMLCLNKQEMRCRETHAVEKHESNMIAPEKSLIGRMAVDSGIVPLMGQFGSTGQHLRLRLACRLTCRDGDSGDNQSSDKSNS